MFKLSPLLVLSIAATLLMIGVGMIVALLPQRVHAMSGSLSDVGLVASVFALAYLLAQLPVSVLSDRMGTKCFLVIGYFICAASGIVFFASETTSGIYLGRAIQGLGEAPIWALGPAMLSLAYPTHKGRAIGTYNASIHLGLTCGPLLGLLIAPEGLNRAPFLVFATFCFLSGLLVLLLLKPVPVPRSQPTTSVRQFLAVFRVKSTVALLLGVLAYGSGYGVFVSVLPISLIETHGFGSASVNALFVVFYAAISVSQIVSGVISDKVGRRGFLIWGMFLAAFGLAALPIFSGLWVFLPLGLTSIGLGMFCVASIAELNDSVADNLKGAISGCFYFFWGTGYVLGPLVVGNIASIMPYAGFTGLALLFLLQGLSVSLLKE